MMSNNLKVVCVLRSGGDFTPAYVANLERQVRKNTKQEIHFICYTDMEDWWLPNVERVSLRKDWPGWWSKMEVFRMEGPALYLDLDTAVFDSLDPMFEALSYHQSIGHRSFWMLKPFAKREKWASGVMAWTGDWSDLFWDFDYAKAKDMEWDQRWISQEASKEGEIRAVQDFLAPVYSFKHHCRENRPTDARIVCFHGTPRPHQVGGEYFTV